MMKLRSLLVFFSLFLFAVFARAQAATVHSVQAGDANDGIVVSSGSAVVVSHAGSVGGVTGASFSYGGNRGLPFSADVIEENDKFPADGNHIHYEVQGKIFRDSEGRIRTETEAPVFTLDSKPFVHINITDLVEGRIIFLDTKHKIATVTHLGHPVSRTATGIMLPRRQLLCSQQHFQLVPNVGMAGSHGIHSAGDSGFNALQEQHHRQLRVHHF